MDYLPVVAGNNECEHDEKRIRGNGVRLDSL